MLHNFVWQQICLWFLTSLVEKCSQTPNNHFLVIFFSRAAVDQIWVSVCCTAPEDIARYERRRRIITTVIWFVTTLLIAIVLPNIGIVIDFLGSFAALFAFFFPGNDYSVFGSSIVQIFSGITCVRVPNGELYAQRLHKLLYLDLWNPWFPDYDSMFDVPKMPVLTTGPSGTLKEMYCRVTGFCASPVSVHP